MFSETQRIKIAKWMDEYVGRLLILFIDCLSPILPRERNAAKINRILLVKFWGIGSIILAEPALRYLRKKFPATQIDFLTLAQNCELFALIPHVDQVYTLDFKHIGKFLLSAVRLVAQLRRPKYDLIFDAEFFANFSALLSRLLNPRRLIGFSRPHSVKNRLLDMAVPFDDDEHAARNFFRLVKIGGCDKATEREKVMPHSCGNNVAQASPPADKMSALPSVIESLREKNILPRLALPSSHSAKACLSRRPVVIMNINASPLALERRWPQERFVHLAKWLLRRHEIDIILIGSRAEKKYMQAVAQAIDSPARIHDLAGTLNLTELAELISQAVLFISNDSGPLHLAAALQKPVVGFYGPETPKRFGPLCDTRLIFYLGLPCSPCMSVDNAKTVNCTNNRRCMLDLKTALVIPRLQHFIDENELLPRRISKNEITTKEVIPSHKMSF